MEDYEITEELSDDYLVPEPTDSHEPAGIWYERIEYRYNRVTKEYTESAVAQINPMESGEHLLSEFATWTPPPLSDADQVPVWNGTEWGVVSVWTDARRKDERAELYAHADEMIAKHNDYVMLGMDANGDHAAAVLRWREYKINVRETQYADSYPAVAYYPEMPNAE